LRSFALDPKPQPWLENGPLSNLFGGVTPDKASGPRGRRGCVASHDPNQLTGREYFQYILREFEFAIFHEIHVCNADASVQGPKVSGLLRNVCSTNCAVSARFSTGSAALRAACRPRDTRPFEVSQSRAEWSETGAKEQTSFHHMEAETYAVPLLTKITANQRTGSSRWDDGLIHSSTIHLGHLL